MIRRLLGFSTVFALAACGSTLEKIQYADEQNVGICPNAYVLEDAAEAIDFAGDPALETVAWSAEITDVRTSCRYVEDQPIRARVEIDFAVGKGPAASADTHELSYFVAVTRTNRNGIAKETFVVPVRVKGDVATVDLTEKVENILIPRKDSSISGTNFSIAVGLTLTTDQVLYNRSGKSLKFPEL